MPLPFREVKARPFRIASRLLLASVVSVALIGAARAVPVKKPTINKPPAVNATKGQGQMAGGNGKFGVIYTLNNDINFEVLSAAYQLTPFPCYSKVAPNQDEKLLVLTLAVKNVSPSDNYIGDFDAGFSAFDDKGQKYDVGSGCLSLSSLGDASFSPTLKPGQGFGQPGTNDPVRLGFPVAANAHIVKLILNKGRAGKSEDVVRFYMADATKENAGDTGDPVNVIAPLPDGQHDPADKTGSIVPAELNGGKPGGGIVAISADYGTKLLSFNFLPDDAKFGDNAADDGKHWAVATISIANLSKHNATLFDAVDTGNVCVTSSDGDNYQLWGTRKARTDEETDSSHVIPPGQFYVVREVFLVPKSAELTKYTYLAGSGHKWVFDITGAK